jgi:bacterioferritin-associated ferredoxin
MYLCICNGLTENDVKNIIEENPTTDMDTLRDLGVADNCCRCYYETQELLIAHINEKARQIDNKDH